MVTVADSRQCELGEGPLWHPGRGQLFWFDILKGRLLSRARSKPLEWSFGECASAAGWVDDDTLLVATETGLRRFDIASGDHEQVCPLEADNPGTRSNDGRADPMGGFWIGTMGKRAEDKAGAIYRYYKGDLRRLYGDITVPNAICFAGDGRTAFYTDSRGSRIMRQPLDAEGWPEGTPGLFADVGAMDLKADGAVIDAEGYLWTAHWGSGKLGRFTPDGQPDISFDVPAKQPTCPVFGGPDLSRLYTTSAYENLTDPSDRDGLLYLLKTDYTGRPEPAVILPG